MKNLQFNKIKNLIKISILEDKINNDITSKLALPDKLNIKAKVISKDNGILFGVSIVKEIVQFIDKTVKIKILKSDGSKIQKGTKILNIKGNAKSILKSERIILNYLGHLSGIATETSKLVKKVKKYNTKICCTRKTLPGLRYLQKMAVSCGGGHNNRFNLEDEIFLKDNHHIDDIDFQEKIIRVIKKNKNKKIINVEVDNISQLKKIVNLNINRILLDNFLPKNLIKAIKIIPKKIETEASGNITPINISKFAKTGVNRISLGYITHSTKNFDFSLET